MNNNRFLVFTRAGDNSLHKEWLLPANDKIFDLYIDYYGEIPNRYTADCEYYNYHHGGTKYPRLFELIQKHPEIFYKYDAIWLVDDDISTNATNIKQMFEIFMEQQLWLAQPALTSDSHASFTETIVNSDYLLRHSSFVEVMAPIFTKDTLKKCSTIFNKVVSGWGLDFVWPLLLGNPKNKIAIIDATPVKHTRPVGHGDIYKNLGMQGAYEELQSITKEYGIDVDKYKVKIYSCLPKSNMNISNAKLIYTSTKGYISTVVSNANHQFIEYPTEFLKINSIPKKIYDKHHWNFLKEKKRTAPPTFIAVFENGKVIGTHGSVFSSNDELIWDISHEYWTKKSEHSAFKERLESVKYLDETVVVLTSQSSNYYYHWYFDVIARLELITRAKIHYDKIVINSNDLPFQTEILTMLKIPKSKIITPYPGMHLQASKLIVPSLAGYTGHIPKWATDFFRREFVMKRKIKKINGFERIYISRQNAIVRKVTNEAEVFNLLKKYGFKKIVLENLSVEQQIQIFNSSSIIISPHGGGLTNLTFANPHTKILELFSPKYVAPIYWVLANHRKLDYYYIIGKGTVSKWDKPLNVTDVLQNMTIDITHLNKTLQLMKRSR